MNVSPGTKNNFSDIFSKFTLNRSVCPTINVGSQITLIRDAFLEWVFINWSVSLGPDSARRYFSSPFPHCGAWSLAIGPLALKQMKKFNWYRHVALVWKSLISLCVYFNNFFFPERIDQWYFMAVLKQLFYPHLLDMRLLWPTRHVGPYSVRALLELK